MLSPPDYWERQLAAGAGNRGRTLHKIQQAEFEKFSCAFGMRILQAKPKTSVHVRQPILPHKKAPQAVWLGVLKDSKIADMDYFRIGYFLLALPPLVVSKCALAGVLYKPSSERKVARCGVPRSELASFGGGSR